MKKTVFALMMLSCAVGAVATYLTLRNEVKKRIDILTQEIKNAEDYCAVLLEELDEAKARAQENASENEKPESDVGTEDIPQTPYVIIPDDFGYIEGYSCISLTYYADGVLADDFDEPVDIERTVGAEALEQFESSDDSVIYVRNDRLKTDFEVLLSERTFEELTADRYGGTDD